jgi:hypothetical protein
MRRRISSVLAAAIVVSAALSQTTAQTTRTDSAITGVVTDAATKQPIADAIVQLLVEDERRVVDRLRHFTDTRGRFVFTDLPAGAYSVRATRTGYFEAGFGGVPGFAQSSSRIALADGQWFSTANIAMWRPGSISGAVTDERGEPVVGVYVRALTHVRVGGTPPGGRVPARRVGRCRAGRMAEAGVSRRHRAGRRQSFHRTRREKDTEPSDQRRIVAVRFGTSRGRRVGGCV